MPVYRVPSAASMMYTSQPAADSSGGAGGAKSLMPGMIPIEFTQTQPAAERPRKRDSRCARLRAPRSTKKPLSMNFVVGQRWLCHADPELGLGVVTAVDTRRVTLHFPAVGEDRTYATHNAPLSRVTYREGESIRIRDDIEITVTAVNELRGLLIYSGIDSEGREQVAPELQLSAHVQLTTPLQRLTSGQVDSLAAYQLRVETFGHIHRLQQSKVAGLLGARTSLLPHQIYIAAEVAQRFAPRVLLADEVGLGKTIEAGLILHQQLHTGRASRVLIVVPTPLLHQWLVEMLR